MSHGPRPASPAQITRLMDELNFYVVPVLNVDGYLWTFSNNRNWRKNRAVNGGGAPAALLSCPARLQRTCRREHNSYTFRTSMC